MIWTTRGCTLYFVEANARNREETHVVDKHVFAWEVAGDGVWVLCAVGNLRLCTCIIVRKKGDDRPVNAFPSRCAKKKKKKKKKKKRAEGRGTAKLPVELLINIQAVSRRVGVCRFACLSKQLLGGENGADGRCICENHVSSVIAGYRRQ